MAGLSAVQKAGMEEAAAPSPARRAYGWARQNLFATWFDAALTLLILAFLLKVVPPFVEWAIIDATFKGDSAVACQGREGACWVFVKVRITQFLVGFYPVEELWRVRTAFGFFLAAGGASLVRWRGRRLAVLTLGTLVPLTGFVLLHGGFFGLAVVETNQWGGLMLTLILALVGIAVSLPVGTLLALARRSTMPIMSKLATAFIEVCRGVPLITVLFMSSVMLPIFLPSGMTVDKLLRALVGITLFNAAYMAEVVRGGLQAIPRGQYEAAGALGLSYWQLQRLVVLPQALRLVVPGIVNTFIGNFKDTTLVLIIGMFDLLGIVQSALSDPEWLGHSAEGYVFVGAVFWLCCFTMSRFSRRLETKHER